ncbi:MAG: RNase adapter RapZ [Lachnospiraceae bacterium]|nr:RNase adapter RapZ [Lachnospiraceae bacterium]
MRFVIVTGMSGGGKSTALKMLEDLGYYCADNLPVSLIDKFMELVSTPGSEITQVALGLDVRTDQSFAQATKTIKELKKRGQDLEILFMDASEQALIKRYKETRRVHPLALEGRVEDGVSKENQVLSEIRGMADYVIDTSNLLTRELRNELERIFVKDEEYNSLMITLLSFGFKHGIPADADLVFDVRFLPNPFYLDELKAKTGLDQEVQDYVMQFEESKVFLDKLEDMIQFLIPHYIDEGKNRLVIAIGCTGGQHRSVTLAGELHKRMNSCGGSYGLKLFHRDVRGRGGN